MVSSKNVLRAAPVLAMVLALAGGVGGCKKPTGQTCHYTAEENTVGRIAASVYCPAGQECAVHEPVCITGLCGNNRVDDGEQCDDGNTKGGDGCSADCKSNEQCGNGVWDKGLVDVVTGLPKEPCDISAEVTPSCNANCELTGCGNSTIDTDEQCDLGTDKDGNPLNGRDKVCTDQCKLNVCGDGRLFAGHETCELSDKYPNPRGYKSDCLWALSRTPCKLCSECQEIDGRVHYCGDGTRDDGNEECDWGDRNGSSPCPYGEAYCTRCSTSCKLVSLTGPFCGDGQLQGAETCDDYISFYCGTCGAPVDADGGHDKACLWQGRNQATGTLVFKCSASQLDGVIFSVDGFDGGPKKFEFAHNGGTSNGHVLIPLFEDQAHGGGQLSPQKLAEATASLVYSSTAADQNHPINASAAYDEQTKRWGVTLNNVATGVAGNKKIVVENDGKDCLEATGMTGGRGCGEGQPCKDNSDCVGGECNSNICTR